MSKLKTLIVGFIITKIVVTGIYFAGVLPVPEIFVRRAAPAEAQQTAGDAAALPEAVAEGDAEAADPQAQLAEVMALMNQLEVKRVHLKEEALRIETERGQLEALKQEIDLKLDELAAVQATLDASLQEQARLAAQEQQEQDAAEAAKIKQLVKVYTSMSPKKAAEIIDKLDMKVVYDVFSNMKGEQVGQILTYVNGERAAEITERMAMDGTGP